MADHDPDRALRRAEHEEGSTGAREGDSTEAGSDRPRFVDRKVAAVGGVLGALITGGTMFALGSVGDVEARAILESTLPTLRFIASTIATATATILALMLTMLGLSQAMGTRLKHVHYQRIAQVSWMSSFAIIGSVFLLIFLALPLGEAENFPTRWFESVYYAVIGWSALLGGLFFAIVITLLNAVRGVIAVIHPSMESGLVMDEE